MPARQVELRGNMYGCSIRFTIEQDTCASAAMRRPAAYTDMGEARAAHATLPEIDDAVGMRKARHSDAGDYDVVLSGAGIQLAAHAYKYIGRTSTQPGESEQQREQAYSIMEVIIHETQGWADLGTNELVNLQQLKNVLASLDAVLLCPAAAASFSPACCNSTAGCSKQEFSVKLRQFELAAAQSGSTAGVAPQDSPPLLLQHAMRDSDALPPKHGQDKTGRQTAAAAHKLDTCDEIYEARDWQVVLNCYSAVFQNVFSLAPTPPARQFETVDASVREWGGERVCWALLRATR